MLNVMSPESRVEDIVSRDTLERLWVRGADEKDLDPD